MKLAPVNWNSESIIELYQSYMSEVDHSSWYLEELMRLGYECDTITEIGMFQGHSISAFLRTRPKKITGYNKIYSLYHKLDDFGLKYNYSVS